MNKQDELMAVLSFYDLPIQFLSKYKIVCPFHGDVNASMLVDLENGKWFCFGCQKGGDAKDFVQNYEQCGDFEAYLKLNKILAGSKFDKKQKIQKVDDEDNRDFQMEAEDYYFNLSTVDWKKPKKYNAQEEFDYLENRGFNRTILNDCGCKVTFNDKYPIIFPMFDLGDFRGYVCRTMDKEVEQKRKYLYNKGFTRRDTLVGNYKNSVIMVVEGYMDYLKARQFGVKYVCALLGWKATTEQIEKMKQAGVKTIISALDNDECGKKGTAYLSRFFEVYQFAYPEYIKDIGEMNIKQFKKYKQRTIENRRNKYGLVKQYEKRNSKIRRKQRKDSVH